MSIGLQIHVHTIGDGAVTCALNGIENAYKKNNHTTGKHHLAHLQLVDPNDIPRFKSLGVTANMSPFWFVEGTNKIYKSYSTFQ